MELTLCVEFDWQTIWPIRMQNLPFLSNKQTRQERLTSVDSNLKNGVYWPRWNKIPSDVHSCLFHAKTGEVEEMIGSCAAWSEVLQWFVFKPQNSIVWIPLKITNLKAERLCSIAKVPALSCLLACCQFPLYATKYFSLHENMCGLRASWLVRHSNSN